MHLWRRGETFSNAATIAKVCRIKRDTVFKILRELEELGLIKRVIRPGRTSLIQPIPSSGVAPSSRVAPAEPHHPAPLEGLDQPPQGGHKGTTIKVSPESIPNTKCLPFETEAFHQAWMDWEQHRREIRKKLTPLAARKALSALEGIGEQRAIVAINYSISNGWTGIHEPKSGKQAAGSTDHRAEKQASEFPENMEVTTL